MPRTAPRRIEIVAKRFEFTPSEIPMRLSFVGSALADAFSSTPTNKTASAKANPTGEVRYSLQTTRVAEKQPLYNICKNFTFLFVSNVLKTSCASHPPRDATMRFWSSTCSCR